ncbi:uncharacterized protein I206_106796 [Kwoniella pini CBS 10737]|uniref:Transcription factor domain-containing protein n=1 Tax=Kwoniella pini CBS 10737 TaxID=1296096 RepID=A0AAJ8MTH5_9TREE
MEGHTPAPASASQGSPATSSEVEALKDRLELLEKHIVRLVDIVDTAQTPNGSAHKSSPHSHSIYPTPLSHQAVTTPASAPSKSTAIDKTFLALDDLSRGYTESPGNDLTNHSSIRSDIPRPVDIWPSVFKINESTLSDTKTSQLIYEIVSVVPEDQVVSVLVDHHLTNDGIFWHFVQENVFKAELSQFTQARHAPSLILVDPAWLALLIAILRVSIQSLLSDNDLAATLLVGNKAMLKLMDRSLADAFETAMYASKVLHEPQVRILQALLLLMGPQQLGRFLDTNTEKGTLWHDVAVSLCIHLRLTGVDDTVTDDDLPRDPAFPAQSPLYTREWSSRYVHSLLFLDEVLEALETDRRGSSKARSVRLTADHVTSPAPRNFRDEDLWCEGIDVKRKVEPQPSFVLTEVSWQNHAFRTAYYWKIISGLIRDPSMMTLDIVRSIDSELRQGDNELLSLRNSHQLTRVQDILLESFHGSYQQRCLRLHRQYFLRSYSDRTYDFSQSAALSAARSIVQGHKNVVQKYDTFNPRFLALVFFSHHVSATVLLFIHGCLKPSARSDIQSELQSSLTLFINAIPPNSVEDRQTWTLSVGRGKLFIEAMLTALSNDPPADLSGVENYLLHLNQRGSESPSADQDSSTALPDETFTLPSLLGMFDDSGDGYIPNGGMSAQYPAQLDMFMGF